MLSIYIGVDAPVFTTKHTTEMPISVRLMVFNEKKFKEKKEKNFEIIIIIAAVNKNRNQTFHSNGIVQFNAVTVQTG